MKEGKGCGSDGALNDDDLHSMPCEQCDNGLGRKKKKKAKINNKNHTKQKPKTGVKEGKLHGDDGTLHNSDCARC